MNEVDARKDEPETRKARSTVDSGPAAVMAHVEGDRPDTAMMAEPGAEDPPAVQVVGERVEIASAMGA